MHLIFFSFPSSEDQSRASFFNSGSLRGSKSTKSTNRPSTLFAGSFPNLDENNQFIINLCITIM